MAKKKLSLKPVQRGFATTSVASKKPKDEPEQDNDQMEEDKSGLSPAGGKEVNANVNPAGLGDTAPNGQATTKEDWEDEAAMEQAALQILVDRLHDKGEKEVARVLKTIEFDKRLAASFPKLEINQDIRDRVLALALEEDTPEPGDVHPVRALTPVTGSTDTDRAMVRLFVAHHVLLALGFSEERISQCLLYWIGESDGWEEALEWMWLHLSEDECLGRGEFALAKELEFMHPDEPLTESHEAASLPNPPLDGMSDHDPVPTPSTSDRSPSPTQPFFQSLDETLSSDSQSDSEPDLNKVNDAWAHLMLELDNLRISAGGASRARGKKSKGNGVILETPDMRRLKEVISKLEKEYMFSRKDGDALFKLFKSKRDADALAVRLKGAAVQVDTETQRPIAEGGSTPDTLNATPDVLDGSGSEDGDAGGIFGNMLDEPDPDVVRTLPRDEGPAIPTRSMPIPKQFSFAGNTPKTLLKAHLTKSSKHGLLTYARLSGQSRAARAGLEIRWSEKRRRVWRMDDIACDDMNEAENYVATLALSELNATGELQGVNWRTMPLDYRDLWEELEVVRKDKQDVVKREVWARLRDVLDKKMASAAPVMTEVIAKPTAAGNEELKEKIRVRDEYNARLQSDFDRRQSSAAYQQMKPQRNNLPIAAFRHQIVSTLETSQILVLSGETGCGKSTQLPSFLLEDQLSKGKPCKIYVTEPRRISAISLAQRVSQELGDAPGAMGSTSSLIGYSIRLEAKVSPSTRLAFVTNGIALRMLESGSGGGSKGTAFDEITHIIVDEVHERSIESDFLLIVLKSLVQQRKALKVVLMSATVDAEKISNFFGGCPFLSVPGRTFPVQVNYLEDAVEAADWHIDETSHYAVRGRNRKAGAKQLEWNEDNARADSDSDDEDDARDPAKLAVARYSARTVNTVNLLDSRQIPYDLIVRLLERICFENSALQSFSAATLVFMPGLAEIRKLNDMLQGHSSFGSGEFVVYPLHSTISSEGQSQVFDIPPAGVRKIVISTNIAETGVTIPDITCVIDSGKHREMRYDEKRQISRLVETYIARSNAKQRRGRAGRVQEGLAFHLFTKARHDTQLAEHSVPEMLRLSLQDLALRIKILRIKLGTTIEDVLLKALDPPLSVNVQRAIASLVEVKALTLTEEITPMGRLLSRLPMDVHLGKFLLVAALFKCLDPALTIAATLNSKSPFVTPFGFEGQADLAKKGFAVGNSDFLTIANVFSSWRRASDNPGFVKTFCRRNFVSQQNLQQIEELRQQLLAHLIDSSFVETSPEQRQEINQARYARGFRTRFVTVPAELNANAENPLVISAALGAGLYPKLVSLDASSGMKTIINQQPVAIHPSSINFKTPRSDFGTNYLTYFTIVQSKKLYAWETGPVDDRALALLCGDQADFRVSASSLQLDRKVRYRVSPKTAMAIKVLREHFAQTMSARFRGKPLSDQQEIWFDLGLKCLVTGLYVDEQQVGVL